jgi:NAD(P)-dependent dehydrogenase (short-subunit alcohol dehydrogenase family)
MNDTTRSFLILGGAGAIGSAVARRLAAAGHHVVLGGRTEAPLRELADEVGGTAVPLDARDFDQVAGAVDRAREVGVFSGAMNAVGSIELRPASATSRETFDAVIETNLTTAFALVRSAGAALARGDGGSLVLMSSAAGSFGLPNHEAIAAAKGGVEGLTRAAAASLAGRGVRVNAIAPGLVDTPLAERITSNEKALAASVALHPLGRIGTADEVAALASWLLTEDGSWVTGAVVPIDGGMAHVRRS